MIQGKWLPMGSDISKAVEIRQTVFSRGEDELDRLSQSVLVFDDDLNAVATGRIHWEEGAFWLTDLCVLEKYRNHGFGDLLVRLLLFKALTHSAKEIRLYPTKDTVEFFRKYGFEEDESGVMYIDGNKVQLSHCSGHCETCGK